MNMGLQAARVIGPAAAGLVVAHFGPASSFAIDGACFLVCAIALLQLRIPALVKGASQDLLASIRAGLAYAWADRALLGVLAIVIALNFAPTGPFQIGLVLIARPRSAPATSLATLLPSAPAGSPLRT